MGLKILFLVALFAPIMMLATGVSLRAMTHLPKLVYAAIVVALLCASVGVIAAEAWEAW